MPSREETTSDSRKTVRNTRGNKAEFVGSGRPLYAYVSAASSFSGQAKVGRRFVYVLALNPAAEHDETPFYVGQSDNLTKRFGNHKQINWHVDRFNQEVAVLIAGSVPETMAPLAARNLADRFVKSGYLLKDTIGAGSWGRRSQGEIEAYLATPKPSIAKIIVAWQKFWREQEQQAKKKQSVTAPPFLTQPDVVRFFNQRSYPSSQVVKLAQRLAADFDPTGRSSYLFIPFKQSSASRRKELEITQQTINDMNGDWRLTEPLRLESFIRVELAQPIINAVAARASKSEITRGTANSFSTRIKATEIAQRYGANEHLDSQQRAAVIEVARYFDVLKQNAVMPIQQGAPLGEKLNALTAGIWKVQERRKGATSLVLTDKARRAIIESRDALPVFVEDQTARTLVAEKRHPAKKQVLQMCKAKEFATNGAKKLNSRLAQGYDEFDNSSTINFAMSKSGSSKAQEQNLQADLADLETIWYTNEDMKYGIPTKFFLRFDAAQNAVNLP